MRVGWIDIEKQMPPEGLHCLLEVSGSCIGDHGESLLRDHSFCLGCWIIPQGETEIKWLLDIKHELYYPTIHAWMPLPKHYQPQEHFDQEPDLMEHSIFEDDPEYLYKGNYVYEQMSLDDFLKGAKK